MTNVHENMPPRDLRANQHSDSEDDTGLVDIVRTFYQYRVRFLIYFLLVFALGALVFFVAYFSSPPAVEGTLGLNFRGIEKNEYPSGKRFSVEDFRSPALLSKALADAGISMEKISLRDLSANLNVDPAVPPEVQNRWKKQDKDGAKREEYYPTEFKISITVPGIANNQRLRLFDALIQRYKERVKYDQQSAPSFVASWDISYEKLTASYDPWDVPELFRKNSSLLNSQLNSLAVESMQYADTKYQLSFREIARALDTWDRTRLQALEALTYQWQLVRNREIIEQRIRYQLQELEILIRQESQEAGDAMKLLMTIDRPNTLLAGQLSNREGVPLVDAGIIDRLMKSDYVGPVVQRISTLQKNIQEMEAEKARLQKQLGWLPTSMSAARIPSGYKELIDTLSSELTVIINNYNRTLEEYLTATITSLVIVKQPPLISRSGYSPTLVLAGIAFLSLFLAVFFVMTGRLFERMHTDR